MTTRNALGVGVSCAIAGTLVLAPSGVTAQATRKTATVRVIGGAIVPGAFSRVVRNDEGIAFTIHTHGLDPGAAYTVWAVIFNNPAGCSVPCDANDPRTVRFATGHVLGNDGVGDFGGHIKAFDAPNDPNQIRLGDGMLTNPRGAEIHFVVRSHGAPQPGLVDDQISTFGGGCTEATGGGKFGPVGTSVCVDRQVSVQTP